MFQSFMQRKGQKGRKNEPGQFRPLLMGAWQQDQHQRRGAGSKITPDAGSASGEARGRNRRARTSAHTFTLQPGGRRALLSCLRGLRAPAETRPRPHPPGPRQAAGHPPRRDLGGGLMGAIVFSLAAQSPQSPPKACSQRGGGGGTGGTGVQGAQGVQGVQGVGLTPQFYIQSAEGH